MVPYIVLVVSLTATLLVVVGFRHAADERDFSRFRAAVQSTRYLIKNRIDTYSAVLLATRGMLETRERVSRQEFSDFVERLELARLYPGLQGVGVTRRVSATEREALEQQMRSEGLEGFAVWPLDDRSELFPITYIEPLDRRNRAALGYDMSTEPVRREAMARARDTGLPAASGPVTLVQEIDGDLQAGFLIYAPLYSDGPEPTTVAERRERHVGFVYSPFRVGDLLAGIFGTENQTRVSFAIYDRVDDGSEQLLFQSPQRSPDPQFQYRQPLEVGGRTWSLSFASQPVFEQASDERLLPYISCAGFLVSLMLFLLSRRQVRAQESLRLHARVVESMAEGVSVSDEHGTILYTNPAEDDIFGYQRGELVGQSVMVQNNYSPEENLRVVEEVMTVLREQGSWSGEFLNVKKDGTPLVTAARISALEIGGRPHWICVQEDISERKRGEQERAALLEREHQARAAAEAASRAKDEFLAMLGHELRNPLAPIVTALQLIELKSDGQLDREHLVIERQVSHLSQLVDDLLDVSRITRGRVELARRPLDVRSVLSRAIEMASPLVEQREHELIVDVADDALQVEGDELRLAQVFSNLLTNAAKYTEPGGRIRVRARREGAEICVAVRDSGLGIPAELLPRIFDLFTQGERTIDRSQGGLGIGLTLVKQLVEAHGGRIEAHSDGLGEGSEFVACLPALEETTAPAEPPRADAAAADRGEGRRILVVDDNEDAAELLAELFRVAGYDVQTAHDGPSALELALEFKPELAVLDIGLPVMDGIELAAKLRELGPIALIALSGYGQPGDRERTSAAGFASHFVKPVNASVLIADLSTLLSTPPPPPEPA